MNLEKATTIVAELMTYNVGVGASCILTGPSTYDWFVTVSPPAGGEFTTAVITAFCDSHGVTPEFEAVTLR